MFMDAFQRRVLGIFTTLQRISILNFYVLFIRRPYYLLLENFLEKMIIVGSYRRTMILSTPLEKHRNGRMKMILRGFLGYHRVQT